MDLTPYMNRSGDFDSMTDREKMVGKVFASVLGVEWEVLSAHSDFFLLGGDSIKAIIFSQQCLAEGLSISTKDLFTRRTIKQIARHAEHAGHEELADISVG